MPDDPSKPSTPAHGDGRLGRKMRACLQSTAAIAATGPRFAGYRSAGRVAGCRSERQADPACRRGRAEPSAMVRRGGRCPAGSKRHTTSGLLPPSHPRLRTTSRQDRDVGHAFAFRRSSRDRDRRHREKWTRRPDRGYSIQARPLEPRPRVPRRRHSPREGSASRDTARLGAPARADIDASVGARPERSKGCARLPSRA